ncbi:MAG: hypothetical protein IK081_02215 [Lachnospiraceae bacterium]|nr:hypothetical protein [Lachnospiraceae bacterium]
MSNLIREYYEKADLSADLLTEKLEKFERNPDIAKEFEYWIKNGEFKCNGIEEKGYTAEKLASLSDLINGEGAFILLIELREKPEKALKRINGRFVIR